MLYTRTTQKWGDYTKTARKCSEVLSYRMSPEVPIALFSLTSITSNITIHTSLTLTLSDQVLHDQWNTLVVPKL